MTAYTKLIERLREIEFGKAAEAIDALQGERDALAAELATLKAQEPVGFVAPHDLKTLREGYPATVVMLPNNKRTEPLYAAPKALAPLTYDAKRAMWIAATIEMPSQENCYLRGIADAERHHGIGGTP